MLQTIGVVAQSSVYVVLYQLNYGSDGQQYLRCNRTSRAIEDHPVVARLPRYMSSIGFSAPKQQSPTDGIYFIYLIPIYILRIYIPAQCFCCYNVVLRLRWLNW